MMNNNMIRLLTISTTKFELDGITNVIMNYYRTMDKSDMQIDFVIPNIPRKDLKEEIKRNGGQIYVLGNRMRNPISYVRNLTKLIKERNYDIVHAHGNSCTLALEMYAAKKGGVNVRISHSHNTTCKYKIAHILLRKMFDAHRTHAFACGQKAGEWLYKEEPFEIVKNGIDIEKYRFNEEVRKVYRDKYNLNEKKVIGHVGHFSYQKNHEFLINVFSELYKMDDSYRLLLVGDGILKKEIEQMINNMHLSDMVIFTGKTPDVPQLMQAMDVMVLPSRYEGLPLTLIEAQAACLPCFVSDTVSNEVAITDLVNFISLDKPPVEWARIIDSYIYPNRKEKVDKVCNRIIEQGYSIKDNAVVLKKLYKRYIEERK